MDALIRLQEEMEAKRPAILVTVIKGEGVGQKLLVGPVRRCWPALSLRRLSSPVPLYWRPNRFVDGGVPGRTTWRAAPASI